MTTFSNSSYVIEFSDGTIHKIHPCCYLVEGTMIGDRTYQINGNLCITDEKNDFISFVEFNPDERSSFTKIFSGRKTFPDYYR